MVLSAERLREGWQFSLLLSGFLSCFMVPSWSAQRLYRGAEEHSPRWLHRHRNLSISPVTFNPLVCFRLVPLNIFDFGFLKNNSWVVKSVALFSPNQTWPLPWQINPCPCMCLIEFNSWPFWIYNVSYYSFIFFTIYIICIIKPNSKHTLMLYIVSTGCFYFNLNLHVWTVRRSVISFWPIKRTICKEKQWIN